MIHEGQVRNITNSLKRVLKRLQLSLRTTTCDVHAICTCHKLKRSWPKTMSRRLGSYLTFSISAFNLRPTSLVATPSKLAKITTKLKERTMDYLCSSRTYYSCGLWWVVGHFRVRRRTLLGRLCPCFTLYSPPPHFATASHFLLYKYVFHCSKTLGSSAALIYLYIFEALCEKKK